MVQHWEPDHQYETGAVVDFDGVAYKVVKPHKSQSDSTPSVTSAFWDRMEDQSCLKESNGGEGGGHTGKSSPAPLVQPTEGEKQKGWMEVDINDETKKQLEIGGGLLAGAALLGGGYAAYQRFQSGEEPQPQQQPQQQQQQQQPHPQYSYGSGDVNKFAYAPPNQPTEEASQKGWLEDGTKRQLEIAGGALAGAALLGGGYAAYQQYQNSDEDRKAAWAPQNLLNDAKNRIDALYQGGPQARDPTTWVSTQGTAIPEGAIEGGREGTGEVLFIARTHYEDDVRIGKAGRHFHTGAQFGHDGKEVGINDYEVLVGDSSKVKWASKSDNDFKPQQAVVGGKKADGTRLLIAQANYRDGTHPGTCNDKLDGACITYGGHEKFVTDNFRILVLTEQQ